MIRYVDSSGWTWAVCELADRPHPGGSAAEAAPPVERQLTRWPTRADAPRDGLEEEADAPPGELYFFSRLGTRKLRGYPARWAELPRAGLEALCAQARDVGMDGAGAFA